jgi:O-antigen ligase
VARGTLDRIWSGSPRVVIRSEWGNLWGWTTGTAHNFLLESLLSVGLLGTLPLLITAVGALVMTAARYGQQSGNRRAPFSWAFLTLTVFIIVDGMVEKSFAGMVAPATVILALVLGSHIALRSKEGVQISPLPAVSRITPSSA